MIEKSKRDHELHYWIFCTILKVKQFLIEKKMNTRGAMRSKPEIIDRICGERNVHLEHPVKFSIILIIAILTSIILLFTDKIL